MVVIFSFFTLPVSANEEIDELLSQFESIVPDDMQGITEDSNALVERFSIKGLCELILASAKGERGNFLSFCLLLLGSVAIYFLASGCHADFKKQTEASVGCLIALAVFPTVLSALSSVESSIVALSDFFAALTPIAVGITALGGGAASSTVQAGGMYTAFTFIGGVGSRFFLILTSLGLSLALISAFGTHSVKSAVKGIRGIFGWAVGIFTTLITSVFTLQTLVASAADSAAMRTAKYMATGLIPVVGSAVSGALATLASGLTYAKAVVGGAAIFVIVSLAVSPLVMLLLYRLALTLGASLAGLLDAGGISDLLLSYRFVMDMTVTAYVLSVIVYLYQLILFLRMGVAIS
jgi:stage III sporulation protein AE